MKLTICLLLCSEFHLLSAYYYYGRKKTVRGKYYLKIYLLPNTQMPITPSRFGLVLQSNDPDLGDKEEDTLATYTVYRIPLPQLLL